jgi:hypothetical protein
MGIWSKLTNKKYWLSTLIIVLSVLIFKGLVSDLLTKYIKIGEGVIIDFLSVFILIFLSRLLTEKIILEN